MSYQSAGLALSLLLPLAAGCFAQTGGNPGTTGADANPAASAGTALACGKTFCEAKQEDCVRYQKGKCDSCSSLCSGSSDIGSCLATCYDNCSTSASLCDYSCTADSPCVDAFDSTDPGDPSLFEACMALNQQSRTCGTAELDCAVASRVFQPSLGPAWECGASLACGATANCGSPPPPDTFGNDACAQCPDGPLCAGDSALFLDSLGPLLTPAAQRQLRACTGQSSCDDVWQCIRHDIGALYPAFSGV